MPRAPRPTEKLLEVARSGSKMGRRQQFSTATKRALVDVAEEHFAGQGYAATSLDSIVAGAQVTKGALYHHFHGKQALFEAVFERVEQEACGRITEALRTREDPWDAAMDGLRAFLTVVQDPTYQRVVIQDGPAVLGYERFREQERRSTFALMQDIVRATLDSSTYDLDGAMVETFSRIFYGALSAAGESVTSADDPVLAVARIEVAVGLILDGLRVLSDQGVTPRVPST
ncbi:TetR/AcrR family transcriptional regulator [Nocardioides mangrovicus]|uniref:TetR/AcrR family transcriptional regulator n=1 Tax=Nocardioides mangrovicus TaxID=2478913 RepID=A0A3L8P5A7_9ACTN|nr:TetR/AcrR family transcriptional regulator [Nocardioides mangrovicus]RLV49809.1 TetR/AcrR family transcriptional regulator [Nocardioides mangrovicus]